MGSGNEWTYVLKCLRVFLCVCLSVCVLVCDCVKE